MCRDDPTLAGQADEAAAPTRLGIIKPKTVLRKRVGLGCQTMDSSQVHARRYSKIPVLECFRV
jgi:hypothetical protein